MNQKASFFSPFSLALLGVSVVLLGLALFMTPEKFIALGPLRRSLMSANELVRDTAYLEVAFFRIACGALALLALVIAVGRRRLASSRLWIKISEHQPELSAVTDFGVLNWSLKAMALLAVAGVLFIVLAPQTLAPGTIESVVQEDGVVEYVSALFFLISSIAGIFLLVRYPMPLRHRVVLSLLSFCLFVFFGEEISWGQRIFDVDTLEILKGVNVQNENNLHNLFGYLFPSLFLGAVIVYGVIFPFAAKMSQGAHQIFDLLGLPIASTGLAIGFLIAALFRDWTFEKVVDISAFVSSAEIGEMLISTGFLLLMVETWYSLIAFEKAAVE